MPKPPPPVVTPQRLGGKGLRHQRQALYLRNAAAAHRRVRVEQLPAPDPAPVEPKGGQP
jgi:hypothetical protein